MAQEPPNNREYTDEAQDPGHAAYERAPACPGYPARVEDEQHPPTSFSSHQRRRGEREPVQRYDGRDERARRCFRQQRAVRRIQQAQEEGQRMMNEVHVTQEV